MTMNLECPQCHKPKFAKSIFGSFCTHCLYDSNRDAIQPAPAPSNNIDIERLMVSLGKLYEIDADVPPELHRLIDTMRQLINEEFVHIKRQITSQNIYDILDPYLKVDRNKLIKHLAFQLGEDEEHLRKLVEMMK